MKTAEAWSKQLDLESTDDFNQKRQSWNSIGFIEQIQLDAMKEGMRRAAVITDTVTHQEATIEDAKQAILSAAEQLTEKDLCPEPTKNR